MTAPSMTPIVLAYEETGSGDPILFISGTNDDRNGWAENVPAFAGRYHCITFDNRDVGESPRADESYTVADMAHDALGVLNSLGIVRAHVVGHSMGGLIAQELAFMAPERVRSLVLVGTFPRADPYLRSAAQSWKASARGLSPDDFARSALVYWVGETTINTVGPDDLVAMIAPFIEAQGVEAFCRQVDAALGIDTLDRLSSISAPTLVVWGVEDKIVLENHQRELLSRIPGARYVTIAGAGHSPTFEQPEAFNATVAEFLATVP